ncbi:GlsB/YeaQ/YmgE family stress response membrane protein [Accumulibacter sp.]|uniref:GlsB/YeaQ/YmgE family stress response membrane protein n=1 Tax=Accumulibacter sp. TaxID=2053492 RepID=UPI0025F9F14D|nr:GlsB/YeaQ/YmgE family stress response membrane protein [Accumulibacter sp.]MCP5228546.1 GlsB/YeaQ/YmgE family stress response membrane protein [Accumulibacter sp.]
MSLLLWSVLGLIAGLIASNLVAGTARPAVMDVVVGVVGAVVGGWFFNTFGTAAVGGFKLYSLLVAVVGAGALLLVYHAVLRSLREALFNLDLENES